MQRLITAAITFPVVIVALFTGGWFFNLLVLCIALFAQLEFYSFAKHSGHQPLVYPGLVLGTLVVLRGVLPFSVEPVVVSGILLCFVIALFFLTKNQFASVSATIAGVFYPAYLAGYLLLLRQGTTVGLSDTEGFELMLSVFILVTATDTGAYYIGKTFGKHLFFPRVSPAKTWEGALGGLAAAFIVVMLLRFWVLDFLPWMHLLVLTLIVVTGGSIGDLVESMFKRSVGVKDSGTMLPGHGGWLDRIDALLFATPLAYLYLLLVLH